MATGSADSAPTPTYEEAVRVWTRIGLLSFGGPAGQIAMMHKTLVDEKKWIDEQRYLHALNFCMLLPGPEAMQLATYVGWRLHGLKGGLTAGLLFVIPGAVLMLVLSMLYAAYGKLPISEALLYGVKAAVLAIVVEALLRIARRGLKANADRWLAGLAFVAIFFFNVPFPVIVIAAALFGYLRGVGATASLNSSPVALRHDVGEVARLRAGATGLGAGGGEPPASQRGTVATAAASRIPPAPSPQGGGEGAVSLGQTLRTIAIWLAIWIVPLAAVAAIFGQGHVLVQIAWFFSKLAMVTFGGAYAVLAYMTQDVVQSYKWLQPAEMVDALGLAETTPGPLILVTQFVGYLAAHRAGGGTPWVMGTLGALVTLWATFAPCFLWIFAGAPYVERLHAEPRLKSALAAVTAAVVGVILNLTVWFALNVLFARVSESRVGPLKLTLPDLTSLSPHALGLTLLAFVLMFALHRGIITTLGVCGGIAIAWHLLGLG